MPKSLLASEQILIIWRRRIPGTRRSSIKRRLVVPPKVRRRASRPRKETRTSLVWEIIVLLSRTHTLVKLGHLRHISRWREEWGLVGHIRHLWHVVVLALVIVILTLILSLIFEIIHNLDFVNSIWHRPCPISIWRTIHVLLVIVPIKVGLLFIKMLLHLLIFIALPSTIIALIWLFWFLIFIFCWNKIEGHAVEHRPFLFIFLFLIVLDLFGHFSEIRDINCPYRT